MSKNKVKEEFERKFRNKPVGSRLIFGTKKNPFPQHGFKYDPPAKKKITGASFQRNNFYRTSPQNGFMQVGQPMDGMFANMMLASKFATLDGLNLRGRRAAPPIIEKTLVTTGTDPRATAYTPYEMMQEMERSKRAGEERILEEVVPEAFKAGLDRRRLLTEQAREMRQKLGMEIRGQPKITPELVTMFQAELGSSFDAI